jgi:hypothetical protein
MSRRSTPLVVLEDEPAPGIGRELPQVELRDIVVPSRALVEHCQVCDGPSA